MLVKKKASAGKKNGVSYLNGQIKFQGVSLNVYSYLTDGVLIDTGAQSLHKFFEPFIDEADFDQIMITHFHEDHSGCATYAEKTKKLPIYLNKTSIPSCEKRADYPLYRKLFWGNRKPFRAQAMPDSFSSRKALWDVIDTPGHAFDHKAFLNRETGQLFTGDLFVSEKTKVVLAEESIPEIIRSLERVLAYDFEDVFCSHAGYLENGRAALQRKRNYLLAIQDEVLTLDIEGHPADAICQKLFPKKYPIVKFSRGEWDSRHIVTSILEECSTRTR
ncbi:MBL fold metallo-hydrolase [Cytobacillus firmus]|uniref:MBL fold metallo-hydrolase n=1 Tax=Cytobacillus firmus TaxID=1399 RepID=UPI001580970F|nr:MBL fold metallo-hydrolase [Cytobacillus firmus]MBG9548983.1 beta-lactamase [Cytobacillus firmus]MBG9604090.1 beta-lactamase [Cytobacillus firmus]MDD9313775.1 MBL fold metallo-hydrolase [Cytobacillus firmus]MED1939350.1 MBL fold metallo-hydrolase [Cytobacillus firmus]NUH86200.1 MBL fold metallo-hydrolase [Cytobacillus firmus]